MDKDKAGWTFFTNHAHVLFYIYFHPEMPMRNIGMKVGITERAVIRIIKELEEAGAVSIDKAGRTNKYTVNKDISLRHPIESERTIGDLLTLIKNGRQ